MQVVLLAAGQGTRLQNHFGVPKQLTPVRGEMLLIRTIRQLHEIGLYDITVVTGYKEDDIKNFVHSAYSTVKFCRNDQFSQDKNIYSTCCALETLDKDKAALIIESDVIFSDEGICSLLNLVGKNSCSFVTCGKFHQNQMGAIMNYDDAGNMQNMIYTKFDEKFSTWYKNLGVFYIAPQFITNILELLKSICFKNYDYYYIEPWLRNDASVKINFFDISHTHAASFNTLDEYSAAIKALSLEVDTVENLECNFFDLDELSHIEDFDTQRVDWLTEKIIKEGVWTEPLKVTSEGLVLDGQHRLEAAYKMGLSKVPAFIFDLSQIKIFSLRPFDCEVSKEKVLEIKHTKKIYPYKTVKCIFPLIKEKIKFPLTSLR